MRLLNISSYYLPYVSGYTVYVQRLAEGLCGRGHTVGILTNKHVANLPDREQSGGLTIERSRPLFRLSRGFVSPALIFRFLGVVRNYDAVVLHLPMPEAFILAPLVKITNKRLYLVYHANLNLPSWRWSSGLLTAIVFLNHLVAGILANKIVAHSRDYANFALLLRIFNRKVCPIYPPVVLSAPNLVEVNKWKKELGLSNNKIIGFLGRFVEEKGGDILFESLPAILNKYPNAKIVIAGETRISYENFFERQKELINRHKDRLIFLGLINPEKVQNFLAMCDVLALPSRNECFGLVQVESMLSGCPVVAFNIPGGRVPITETGMGVLVTPYSREEFGAAIVKVLTNRQRYVVKRGGIINIFNTDRTLNNYETIFQS